jgi:integrase
MYRRATKKDVRRINSVLPRFCTAELTRHGRIAIYFRQVGKTGRIRLRADPGSSEFHREYATLLDGETPTPHWQQRRTSNPATWRWLCEGYFSSTKFRDLQSRGQRIRRRQLERTWDEPISPGSELRFGECPLARFNAQSVRVLVDRKLQWGPEDESGGIRVRTNSQAANSLLKYIRGVFEWGKNEHADLVERNWARDVAYFSCSSTGFHTWTLEEIAQFEERHPIGTRARLTLAVALYTTQRRGDLARLGTHLERNGLLVVEQEKNRRRKPITAFVPIAPTLREIIDASPTGARYYIVQEHVDRPYTKESLGNRFKEWCVEAALPHCSLHGLRKAGVIRLIQEDFTPHQIMAVTGHRTLKEIDRYARDYLREQAATRILDCWLEKHAS